MKILKFGAIWCAECIVMKSIWEDIENEIKGINVEYFDIDEYPEMVEEYDIKNVPVYIFQDKNGKQIEKLTGPQNKKDLVMLINKNIDK